MTIKIIIGGYFNTWLVVLTLRQATSECCLHLFCSTSLFFSAPNALFVSAAQLLIEQVKGHTVKTVFEKTELKISL